MMSSVSPKCWFDFWCSASNWLNVRLSITKLSTKLCSSLLSWIDYKLIWPRIMFTHRFMAIFPSNVIFLLPSKKILYFFLSTAFRSHFHSESSELTLVIFEAISISPSQDPSSFPNTVWKMRLIWSKDASFFLCFLLHFCWWRVTSALEGRNIVWLLFANCFLVF